MRHTQRGMTFIGLAVLVAFVGVFVYAGIRLVPLYLEYMNVVRAMESLKSEGASGMTQASLRVTLEKRLDINDVTVINVKDIEIKRENEAWQIHAVYDATTPFVGNIEFLVHFDKTVRIGESAGV
jgi:hypothetical protein